jgi:hypothetical protein
MTKFEQECNVREILPRHDFDAGLILDPARYGRASRLG